MKIRLLIAILLYVAFALSQVMADASDDLYIPEYSKAYDPSRDPFADGKEALQYAQQTNRRVLIEVGGDWCSYCKVLDYFINNNPTIKNSLYERFVVLKVNISDENDNKEFISGLPKTFGYPHIFITENDGTVILSKDTSQLLQNGKYSEQRFIDFLDEWGPPASTGGL